MGGFLSCAGQHDPAEQREKEVYTFLAHVKANDAQGVNDMSYHVNYPCNVTDERMREHYVKIIADLIAKYGIPGKDKWITKLDHNGSGGASVTIPIFPGKDADTSLTEARIIIKFPPATISEKMFDFELINIYKPQNQDLSPPPPVKKGD
jgi:hypothetical protein